ncbi:MAG TPA: response regulator, partial [Blastocatellia bacterium]|nr:response regulator [Blastocatellia bacterium]
ALTSEGMSKLKDGPRGVWKMRMEIARRKSILIIEPNAQLREEIVNFLLSAGYEDVAATDSLFEALDKIRQSEYEVTVADAGKPLTTGLQFAAELASLKLGAKIIFMINAEDQQSWDQIAAQSAGARFLIKTDFARNLLYLLEEIAQP